jgi:hypothetical protein
MAREQCGEPDDYCVPLCATMGQRVEAWRSVVLCLDGSPCTRRVVVDGEVFTFDIDDQIANCKAIAAREVCGGTDFDRDCRAP